MCEGPREKEGREERQTDREPSDSGELHDAGLYGWTAARRRLPATSGTIAGVSRVLYLDCFSGISGDMTLGAFLDAGLPLDELKRALGSLALDGVDVSASRVLQIGRA